MTTTECKNKIESYIKEHLEFPDLLIKASLGEHMNMALYSKYPKISMKHSAAILDAIHLADEVRKIQGTYSDEMPRLNFEVK